MAHKNQTAKIADLRIKHTFTPEEPYVHPILNVDVFDTENVDLVPEALFNNSLHKLSWDRSYYDKARPKEGKSTVEPKVANSRNVIHLRDVFVRKVPTPTEDRGIESPSENLIQSGDNGPSVTLEETKSCRTASRSEAQILKLYLPTEKPHAIGNIRVPTLRHTKKAGPYESFFEKHNPYQDGRAAFSVLLEERFETADSE